MNTMFKKFAVYCIAITLTASLASAKSGGATKAKAKPEAPASTPAAVTAADIQQLREAIAAQQLQIQALRDELESSRHAAEAARQAESSNSAATSATAAATQSDAELEKIKAELADVKLNQQNSAISTQDDQKRIVAAELLLNRFRFSGDVRVRGESFFQGYSGCVACPVRNRARIRARLGIDGKLGEDFTGGLYIATGAVVNGAPDFKDPVSTNETLTSFFERKTFGVDRAWITYQPQAHKWLQLTGGKFAFNFQRTSLTFDSDLNPEGFSEKLSFDLKHRVFKNVTFQALQFMFNEVSGGTDSHAVGGQFLTKLQFGQRVTMTPSVTILNWNGSDAIAQAAFPVTLPQPITPPVGNPLPTPTNQPVRVINANAFTNASIIKGVGAGQTRGFLSDFMYSDYIVDTTIKTHWVNFPWRILAEYEKNLRARNNQDSATWLETSLGQQRNRNDLLFGYSFARVEQDSVISQFNESDMRAPTNVVQHRLYFNWLAQKNTTVGFTLWLGRTLNANLQNAAKAPGLPAGMADPWLKRMQLDLIYKF